jgi:hypothetical protein
MAAHNSTRFAPPASASTQLCAELAHISIIRICFFLFDKNSIILYHFLSLPKNRNFCQNDIPDRDNIASISAWVSPDYPFD